MRIILIVLGILYLIGVMFQLLWFTVVGAGLTADSDDTFRKETLSALVWPVYWLKVLLSMMLLMTFISCAEKAIDPMPLLEKCTKVCDGKVRDFKTSPNGEMSCWCDK